MHCRRNGANPANAFGWIEAEGVEVTGARAMRAKRVWCREAWKRGIEGMIRTIYYARTEGSVFGIVWGCNAA